MITKTYYGDFDLNDFVRFLAASFRDENLDVRLTRSGEKSLVRFVSSRFARSGGQFGLNVILTPFEDGVKVSVQDPEALGVAASLGKTAIVTLINPRNLFARLDDVAQDLENITLDDSVVKIIDVYMKEHHLSLRLSERLSRSVCEYCQSTNAYGVSNCVSCGAPMGAVQIKTCSACGYGMPVDAVRCSECGKRF